MNKICDYCNEKYEESDFYGGDGVWYDEKNKKYYFIIEYFRNKRYKIEIKYCPMCGRKLE